MTRPEDIDLTAALVRAEEDGAAWLRLLETEPDPLMRQLVTVGVAGLSRRWGFDHAAAIRFGSLYEVDQLNLPPGMPEVPVPDRSAGEIEEVIVYRAPHGEPWTPFQGLALRWRPGGNPTAQHAFSHILGGFFLGFFASVADRLHRDFRVS